jgi:hypothetical protein
VIGGELLRNVLAQSTANVHPKFLKKFADSLKIKQFSLTGVKQLSGLCM